MSSLDAAMELASGHPFVTAGLCVLLASIVYTVTEIRRHKAYASARVRPALSRGHFVQVSDRVWHVTGTTFMLPFTRFPRSMTVVRHGDELTLIDTVRLDAAGERALLALGRIAHVVAISGLHGVDLPYYCDTFKPTLWAPAEIAGYLASKGLKADRELRAHGGGGGGGGAASLLPFPGGHVFTFSPEALQKPGSALCEAVIVLEPERAIVSCDAVQNFTDYRGSALWFVCVCLCMPE
jgi:hypothetical protein